MSSYVTASDRDDAWCQVCAVAWPYYAHKHPGGAENTCTGAPSMTRPECVECWENANEEQGALTLVNGKFLHTACALER